MYTHLGEADIVTYAKVERKNGETEYFKIIDGEQIKVSEQEYKENN